MGVVRRQRGLALGDELQRAGRKSSAERGKERARRKQSMRNPSLAHGAK